MALFEVPGWSIPEAPVSLSSSNSRKRKRPADAEAEVPTSSTKLHSAVKNVEKLMASLEGDGEAVSKTQRKRGQRKGGDREGGEQKRKESARDARPNKQKGERKREGNGTGKKRAEIGTPETSAKKANATPTKKPKKDKGKDEKSQTPADLRPTTSSVNGSSKAKGKKKAEGLTSLQADMKNSLDGAKFR